MKDADQDADLAAEVTRASFDVQRLQDLFSDAVSRLMTSFQRCAHIVDARQNDPVHADAVLRQHLNEALIALQFQDVCSQLLARIQTRLAAVERAFEGDDGIAKLRQSDDRAGSIMQRSIEPGPIELF